MANFRYQLLRYQKKEGFRFDIKENHIIDTDAKEQKKLPAKENVIKKNRFNNFLQNNTNYDELEDLLIDN